MPLQPLLTLIPLLPLTALLLLINLGSRACRVPAPRARVRHKIRFHQFERELRAKPLRWLLARVLRAAPLPLNNVLAGYPVASMVCRGPCGMPARGTRGRTSTFSPGRQREGTCGPSLSPGRRREGTCGPSPARRRVARRARGRRGAGERYPWPCACATAGGCRGPGGMPARGTRGRTSARSPGRRREGTCGPSPAPRPVALTTARSPGRRQGPLRHAGERHPWPDEYLLAGAPA